MILFPCLCAASGFKVVLLVTFPDREDIVQGWPVQFPEGLAGSSALPEGALYPPRPILRKVMVSPPGRKWLE